MKHTLPFFLALAFVCLALPLQTAHAQEDPLDGVDNPDLGTTDCRNLDIMIILDASGSISSQEDEFIGDETTGLSGFLREISGNTVGTQLGIDPNNVNNNVAIVDFGTTANLRFGYTEVVTGDELDDFVCTTPSTPTTPLDLDCYHSYPDGGDSFDGFNYAYTNWEDGFQVAIDHINSFSPARWPDWLIWFTDGGPNTSNEGAGGGTVMGENCDDDPLNPPESYQANQGCANDAVDEADEFKTGGSHLFALLTPHLQFPEAIPNSTVYAVSEITGTSSTVWDETTAINLLVDDYVAFSGTGASGDAADALLAVGDACSQTELPVELAQFEGTVDGQDVLLRWGTLSETNNAGFEVQHRSLDTANKADWQTLHFVDGVGTTIQPQDYTFRASGLAPGTHTFRLRQVDYDGAFEYSPTVEVIIDLAETFMIEAAYPNPFNPESTMRFAVQQAQHVEVALFNTLGQQVQTLFTGMAEAGQMQQVTIDGSDLPSGLYLVRVVGERFAETQTITLLK